MTALSADRNTRSRGSGIMGAFPVAASETIYKGSMVALDSDGYLVAASNTSGQSQVVGVADEKVDNSSGSDGDKDCRVVGNRVFNFVATSITQAMLGGIMAVIDDQTFDDVGSQQLAAGILVEFVSTTEGWLWIPFGGINLTAPSAS